MYICKLVAACGLILGKNQQEFLTDFLSKALVINNAY